MRDAVDLLVRILNDDTNEPQVRANAAWALAELGPSARVAVSSLLGVLRHDNLLLRRRAINALSQIGPDADIAVPALIEALKNDPDVRENAAEALGSLGQASVPAVSSLLVAIKDSEPRVRILAAYALWQVDGRGEEVLPVLLAVLSDKHANALDRMMAAFCIGKIGPGAGDATPLLVESLRDDDPDVRRQAAEALWKVYVVDRELEQFPAHGGADDK